MKVGFISYPTLWQNSGGLQIQILKTTESLRALGVNCTILSTTDKYNQFDILHVFSWSHGNHLIIEEAKRQNVKVVVSPLAQNEGSANFSRQVRMASRLFGKVSRYKFKTTYDHAFRCIDSADEIVALSEIEKSTIVDFYRTSQRKVSVIPNGIDAAFFSHRNKNGETQMKYGRYVLVVGAISEYKNQLSVIRSIDEQILLVGPIHNRNYLNTCLASAPERVKYLGILDHEDPQLRSLYAGALVTVLASKGESFGLASVESLALGTPAIITKNNGLGIGHNPPQLQLIDPDRSESLANAIRVAVNAAPVDVNSCQSLVQHLTWNSVALQLNSIYQKLMVI